MTEPQVTYWAPSILRSRTAWFSLLTVVGGLLLLPEVTAVIPLRYLPYIVALTGIVNFILRVLTVRPVAFVGLDQTKAVSVDKIDPPKPAGVLD